MTDRPPRPAFSPYVPLDPGSTESVLASCVDLAGGVKNAAHLLGRSESLVYKASSPYADQCLSFDDMRRLARAGFGRPAADDMAMLCHGVFVPLGGPDGADGVTLAALSAEKARIYGALASQTFLALADGQVSANEARDLVPGLQRLLKLTADALALAVELADPSCAPSCAPSCERGAP